MGLIISKDEERKFICLCAWCDEHKVQRKIWIDKGYSINDGICENCDLI